MTNRVGIAVGVRVDGFGLFISKPALLFVLLASAISVNAAETAATPDRELSSQQKEQFKARFKEDAASILKVVDRWAKSWSSLDIENYLACYSKSFHPEAYPSAAAWRYSRYERFSKQKWVKLNLNGMVLSLKGAGIYAVQFTQDYQSDTFKDSTRKELVFKNLEGKWKITAENTLTK